MTSLLSEPPDRLALTLDTPRGPYPSPFPASRCIGLLSQMSMPQSSVYPQVLWPLVVDTPTVHVPALPVTPGALPFGPGHPPDAHVPVSQGLWPGAPRPSTPSLSPWCAPPLPSLADEGGGAAAARPTVRRVTGWAAPPTASATPGSSGPQGPEPACDRYLVSGHRAQALEDGQDVLLAGVPHSHREPR